MGWLTKAHQRKLIIPHIAGWPRNTDTIYWCAARFLSGQAQAPLQYHNATRTVIISPRHLTTGLSKKYFLVVPPPLPSSQFPPAGSTPTSVYHAVNAMTWTAIRRLPCTRRGKNGASHFLCYYNREQRCTLPTLKTTLANKPTADYHAPVSAHARMRKSSGTGKSR